MISSPMSTKSGWSIKSHVKMIDCDVICDKQKTISDHWTRISTILNHMPVWSPPKRGHPRKSHLLMTAQLEKRLTKFNRWSRSISLKILGSRTAKSQALYDVKADCCDPRTQSSWNQWIRALNEKLPLDPLLLKHKVGAEKISAQQSWKCLKKDLRRVTNAICQRYSWEHEVVWPCQRQIFSLLLIVGWAQSVCQVTRKWNLNLDVAHMM